MFSKEAAVLYKEKETDETQNSIIIFDYLDRTIVEERERKGRLFHTWRKKRAFVVQFMDIYGRVARSWKADVHTTLFTGPRV